MLEAVKKIVLSYIKKYKIRKFAKDSNALVELMYEITYQKVSEKKGEEYSPEEKRLMASALKVHGNIQIINEVFSN